LELVITLQDIVNRLAMFGSADRHLKLIRDAFGVRIFARDSTLKLEGDSKAVGKAAAVIQRLQDLALRQPHLAENDVADLIADEARQRAAAAAGGARLEVYSKGAGVVPKTDGQRAYVSAMLEHDLTFCLGPAGTGKTYLAVAVALSLLKQHQIRRIVLARPAVEAGEKLGYLPGDLQAKVNPYLRPLFDAMHDMMDFDHIRRLMSNDVIEVIPLAFMRGRTLNSAAIILDEAQNTTVQQMLMFLTRLGHQSKMIVTGDDSQVDLEGHQTSGLYDGVRRLGNVRGIAVVRLTQLDIVRHSLVTHIVEAYSNGAKKG
jgi:phosphate starvation-inducible PhoH-like protein